MKKRLELGRNENMQTSAVVWTGNGAGLDFSGGNENGEKYVDPRYILWVMQQIGYSG